MIKYRIMFMKNGFWVKDHRELCKFIMALYSSKNKIFFHFWVCKVKMISCQNIQPLFTGVNLDWWMIGSLPSEELCLPREVSLRPAGPHSPRLSLLQVRTGVRHPQTAQASQIRRLHGILHQTGSVNLIISDCLIMKFYCRRQNKTISSCAKERVHCKNLIL